MFKFLHAADIHLDSRLDGLSRYDGAPVDRIKNACRKALENLVELAIEEQVALVLIAGDVYDGNWQDYNTGLYFAGQMARLREAGIQVVLIAGNHDAANKMTRMLRLPDNVTALATDRPETRAIDDLGVVVHGQGFPTGAVTDDLSRQYPAAIRGCFNIGLLHSCGEGAEGHDPYAPCTLEGLRTKGYDYWALGHIHKRALLSKEPHIAYSGNIQGRHIRETGPKGCLLGTVRDCRLASLEFRRLDVVRWEVCPVRAPESDEDLLYESAGDEIERLLAADDPHRLLVVRVQVEGRSRLHERLLADPWRCGAEIRNRALQHGEGRVWVEQVKIRTVPWQEDIGQGPLEELLDGLGELRDDPALMRQAGEALLDLRGKLPAEFLQLPEAPRFDDPAWLGSILCEVEALLRDRLSPSGTG
jgi:DNA repair exonuclease SbcCD nuclease subunit